MQMLSGHPEILTSNFYPYEVKQSSYWMHLLKILADPADFTNSTHPDGFERNFGFIGHNPYSHQVSVRQFKTPGAYEELYNAKYPADIIDFCTSRIDDFYEVVEKDENKQGARLFAEKFIPSHIQFLLADIYTSPKEIILTRDFRDVICSARSFNQKRNDQGFGRNRASDEKDWVRRVFASGARNLVRAWEARKDNALHVRYEDLVKSTESELKRIFNYLEIDCSPLLLKSIASKTMHTATSSDHRTSNSAEQSIERWRTDLPEDLLSYCNESLRSELEVFGYEQQ